MRGQCWCIQGLAACGACPSGVPARTAAAEVPDGDLAWSQWVVIGTALGRVGHPAASGAGDQLAELGHE